jgi:hypothetical protein
VVRCSSRRIEGCEAHLRRRRADVTQAEITAAKAEIRPNLPTRSAKTTGSWPARRAADEMLRSTKRVAASSPALPRRRRAERVLFLWPVSAGRPGDRSRRDRRHHRHVRLGERQLDSKAVAAGDERNAPEVEAQFFANSPKFPVMGATAASDETRASSVAGALLLICVGVPRQARAVVVGEDRRFGGAWARSRRWV